MQSNSTTALTTKTVSTKRWYIPARYVLVALLFFGTCVSYFMVTNLSLAIVAMVKKTEELSNCSLSDNPWCSNASSDFNSETCSSTNADNSTIDDSIEGPYSWSSKTQGLLQGAFFYGNACAQLIAGRAADKFSAKWLVGLGMLLGSILTILLPVTAELGVVAIFILRALTGITQTILYLCINTLCVRWIPDRERSLMFSICACGMNLGIIISMPVVGWLCRQTFLEGWPAVFYLFGSAGCLWSIAWITFSHNYPSSHPRISNEELQYILQSTPEKGLDPKDQPTIPWKTVLTSTPVWAYVFTYSCSSWVYYSRLTVLPSYLDQVLHYPIEQNGLINSMLNVIFMIFSFTGGYIADFLITKNWLTKTNTRKVMECTALLGLSACLLGVILSECDATLVIIFLMLGSAFHSFAISGDNVINMDMAPALAGTITGFANTFSSATGFISPVITGVILDAEGSDLTAKWHVVFYVSIVLGLMGAVVSAVFWSAEVQPWDPTYKDDNNENNKVTEL